MDVPNLPLLLQQAQAALHTEARQRQEFYDWVREDHKAEFINYVFDPDMMAYAAVIMHRLADRIEARQVPGFQIPVRVIFNEQANLDTLTLFLTD